ncbi:MAG: hypothetical protein OXT65_10800 [Alphaproteobacteria bacterium]|nr:hypothetical protein [Alphaproteobacteria bacterium]
MTRLVLVLSVLVVAVWALPTKAAQQQYYQHYGTEQRTVHRSVTGQIFYPKWVLNVPEHYEFLPQVSNHDAQHRHPAQWEGRDWDPTLWSPGWTPEQAVDNFFRARIFKAQYMVKGMPVLELGPKFFRLSDLDRRRTLKLLADTTGVFDNGHKAFMLRDWYTKDIVGNYTPKGMFLN